MRKDIVQIRDIELIEKELQTSMAGVLAVNLTNEKLIQLVTPYIYKDKNIFVFFNDENEIATSIHLDSIVSFSVLRFGKIKKPKSMDYEPTYNVFSITVRGAVRKVDDQKLAEELRQGYIQKYKKNDNDNIDFSVLENIIIIDSEEIQALEETGG